MHITMTGNLGSGKSTLGKILLKEYNFEIYSTGTIQRQLATEMNLTTLELNQLMCSDHKYDNMIDDATTRISKENKDKNIVFDSRLAWNFVEDSFKVFVSVDIDVAANRVINDKTRGDVESYNSIDEAKELLLQRANTEKLRYKDIYNLDYFDFSNYNLIIDSTYNKPEEIAEIIVKEAYEFEKNKNYNTKYLISPQRLLDKSDTSNEDKKKLLKLIKEYKDKVIISDGIEIEEKDNIFHVIHGNEKVKAAYLANVSYIQLIK